MSRRAERRAELAAQEALEEADDKEWWALVRTLGRVMTAPAHLDGPSDPDPATDFYARHERIRMAVDSIADEIRDDI